MRQIIKFSFILSILMSCMSVTGQNRDNDIFADSTQFAEYIYTNMHYPLIDFINNVEGTATYKFDFDSTTEIKEIKIIHSSGSSSLDREGIRLLWQIPKGNEFPTHEISINFNLADNKIYKLSEVLKDMPEFPGGDTEIIKFISQNFNWPIEAAEMGIQGRVVCGCVIEKDGTINIVEIVRLLNES